MFLSSLGGLGVYKSRSKTEIPGRVSPPVRQTSEKRAALLCGPDEEVQYASLLCQARNSSLGLDASGDCPSVVGFGFIDLTSATPVDYIAAFRPAAGLNDAQVLSSLAALFNADYSIDGFTGSYDSTTDTLSIDQLLPLGDVTWSADSDTGLFLDDSMNTSPVPEPASLLLLSTGLVGLVAFRCRPARAGRA